jgi:sporulation protein YlmC with PRC-barrel domain
MQNGDDQTEVMRGKQLLGLPVYSIAEGKLLGEINILLVRREDFTIPVVGIKRTDTGSQAYIKYGSMHTVGIDIALVETETSFQADLTADERDGLDSDIPNRPVFTQSGESAGHIVGFSVDTTSGRIEYFRIEADRGIWSRLVAMGKDTTVTIPTSMVRSIGPDAMIVVDAVTAQATA